MTSALRTCPLCQSVCGLRLTLDDDNRVARVQGDRDDPFTKGFICPKGASLGRVDEDPDRLRTPMVRHGEQWRQVGWNEAFQAVEKGLNGVIEAHGRDAVALFFGNPTYHTLAGILYRTPLTQSLGSKNIYSSGTLDHMPRHVAAGHLYGDAFAIAVPDLDRTDLLLVVGANPMVTNGSLMAAPDFPGRLRALRKRGGRMVVVDPRRTRTAELADEHLFVRPGTDPVLLLGIVHTLLAENLTSVTLEVNGLDDLRALAEEFTPELAERVCGVPADDVRRLARELAAAPTAAVYSRIGASTVEFGTLAQWLVEVLNILTGNLDRAGGTMFTRPAAVELFRTGQQYVGGNWHSRVRGLPEVLGELPAATLVDEIETPGEGQVRALIVNAANMVLAAPNGPRLDRALSTLDFMVCVDPYLNETTRHANVILPPPRILQMPHFDMLLQTVTVRNYTRFSPPVLPLGSDQLSEGDILAKLTLIVAGAGASADPSMLAEGMMGDILGAFTQIPGSPVEGREVAEVRASLAGDSDLERIVDLFLRLGPYGLSLPDLKANPHGIDLGHLEPRLKELLVTPSGKVELAPPALTGDLARLRERVTAPTPEVLLIGRRQLRSANSWLHNVEQLRGGSNRCTLHINPADVARYGLGERAVVRSATGELVVDVEPHEAIMPGVVSLPHGWGHAGTPLRVAIEDSGVNANTLTSESTVDVPSGNAVFNGVPVTVGPYPA
ncbi:molybdopterin-dependent oxidoreductase [Actinophytocola oryzae]|uniref:Anaerobic selenocysteine-containing dehydrogenase n=1 Tax=Actinophytocola oryzae TaxID=502181 RepID=A0A4R7UWB0_9PSEU|nr:molybdopterin-dependent oxidoreductase [Actinophytocola oryzae]TDV41049.1 anaerobic selenocysteine-containing dehydrogenase [Actinophytocola oryzae]